MNQSQDSRREISLKPCPPKEFSGRFAEKTKLLEVLKETKGANDRGKVVMVSGRRGSGKSSFLNWAEYEIQDNAGGLECPVIKKEFLETAGMVFVTYRELLTDLKGHQKFGWFRKAIDNSKVRKSLDSALAILEKTSSLGPIGPQPHQLWHFTR